MLLEQVVVASMDDLRSSDGTTRTAPRGMALNCAKMSGGSSELCPTYLDILHLLVRSRRSIDGRAYFTTGRVVSRDSSQVASSWSSAFSLVLKRLDRASSISTSRECTSRDTVPQCSISGYQGWEAEE